MDPTEGDPDGTSVVYVDADHERRADTVASLEAAGLTVRSASTPGEAVEAVEGVDCAVLEHDPPAVDGFAVLDRLDEAGSVVPVVFFPSGGDESVAGRAIEAGVAGYVPRHDGGVDHLVRRVEGVVQDQADHGANVSETVKDRAMDAAPVGITLADAGRPDEPLVYVNDSFEELTGYERADILGRNCRFLQGDDSDPTAVAAMREAIDAAEPATVELKNYRADGEPFWNRVDVAPIRDADGEVSHYVGFQTDITERVRAEQRAKRRAEELADERAALERLVDRIEGLVGDVTTALVEATDRETVEREVCERIAAAEPYLAAWIGEVDTAGERIVPSAAVGHEPVEVPLDADDPVARAVRSRSLQRETDPESVDGPDGAGAVAVVPLLYRERVDGVLVVYARDAAGLDDRETAVLAALGRAVGTAENALRTRRVLEADSTVEVELSLADPTLFFVDASARAGCELRFAGAGHGPGGEQTLLFVVEGAPVGDVRNLLADHDGVTDVAVLTGDDDGGLLEVTAAEPSLVTLLAEYGAETESLSAVDGEARVTVGLSDDESARRLVEAIESRYESTDLRALRERQRPPRTKQEFLAALEDRLTDRQRTALAKAYAGGYFDQNRAITGDELADSMDITRSTFHQHLRTAQRKLLAEFFDAD